MEVAKSHIYLRFDILNHKSIKIGCVDVLINKINDFNKWQNPCIAEKEAIDLFKSENSQFRESGLIAFFISDLIPFV